MTAKFLRGAFVELRPVFGLPVPNVIVFQFNPETMTHGWTQPEAVEKPGARGNPLAVRGVPGESFSFSLVLDAGEPIADQEALAGPLAQVSGVYPRLAALEMLQYPVAASAAGALTGTVSVSLSGGLSAALGGGAGSARTIPQQQVPTVLLVWGPGRIVPVRLTSLKVTEQRYDALLNPTHAEATVDVRVLTPDELTYLTGPLAGVAKGAYAYTQRLRQALAVANLGNAAQSVVGMLPF